MGKYLKEFDTHAEYESAKSNLILPNVSICIQENDVHYNPTIDPYNGHAYVDLGLPSGTKWATMNVGANSATDVGLYFQWADTQGYTASQVGVDKTFNWGSYKYSYGLPPTFTKYNGTDGKTVLDANDDAVQVAWGGNWRTPTIEEFQELSGYTTSAFTNDCLVFTSTVNGNTLTFPAGGWCERSQIQQLGIYGDYWTRVLYDSDVKMARSFIFRNGSVNWRGLANRELGYTVRGVVG
jgi:hypothetical protein